MSNIQKKRNERVGMGSKAIHFPGVNLLTMTILNLIKCFDRDFECSISTFELGSRPSTDSVEGAQGDNILVLHVGARLPSQDKILQTDLAKV